MSSFLNAVYVLFTEIKQLPLAGLLKGFIKPKTYRIPISSNVNIGIENNSSLLIFFFEIPVPFF
jgi:hypothetical protein